MIQGLVGVVLVGLGVYLTVAPATTAELLGRSPVTSSDWINLRATFGGTLLGLGAFVAWLPGRRPWQRFVLGLLGWAMAGIGAARLVGFAIDRGPDPRQYVWLVAEVVIAAACFVLVRRRARAAT